MSVQDDPRRSARRAWKRALYRPEDWPLTAFLGIIAINLASFGLLVATAGSDLAKQYPILGIVVLMPASVAVCFFFYAVAGRSKVYDRAYGIRQAMLSRRESIGLVEKYFNRIQDEIYRDVFADRGTATTLELSISAAKGYFQETYPRDNPAREGILPCDFRIYALCVKNVMGRITDLIEAREIKKATVYTYFPRTIFEWYNPFVKIVQIKERPRPYAVAYTEDWWEDYKGFMNQFKNSTEIRFLRLMAHPRRLVTMQGEGDIDFSSTESGFQDIFYVRCADIFQPTQVSRPSEVHQHCRCQTPGFTRFGLIKEDTELYSPTEFFKRARVNCILQADETSRATPTGYHSMLDHFINAHHTRSLVDEREKPGGCYIAFSKKEVFPWGKYSDVFVVQVTTDRAGSADPQLFGMALQMDGLQDTEGLKFMRATEIRDFVVDFDREWGQSQSGFCLVTSANPT